MKIKTNQNGFSAIDIVLLVVAIGAIGAAVYFAVYHKPKAAASTTTSTHAVATSKQTTTPVATSKQTTTQTPSTFVFDIPELGVEFTAPSSLSDLIYEPLNQTATGQPQPIAGVGFSTKALSAGGLPLTSDCMGYLNHASDGGGQKVATVDGLIYYYDKPESNCPVTWQPLATALQSLVADGKNPVK